MNFDDMTDEELLELAEQMRQEVGERKTRRAVDTDVRGIIERYREGREGVTPEPAAEFVQPLDVARSYVAGETVEKDGQLYRSACSGNMCSPDGHCSHEMWEKA